MILIASVSKDGVLQLDPSSRLARVQEFKLTLKQCYPKGTPKGGLPEYPPQASQLPRHLYDAAFGADMPMVVDIDADDITEVGN